MNQQRVILGLATLAVVGSGVWAWYGNTPSSKATDAQSMNASPFRRVDAPAAPQATEVAPLVTAAPEPAEPAAPEDDSTESAAAPQSAEPPPSMDVPEPGQRKFAHGSKAEAEQI